MTTTVTLELTSANIFNELRGHASNNVDEFIAKVQDAGGINLYLESHPFYKYLGPRHKATAIASYYSERMREELQHPRQVAEDENLIVESPEAEPWRDEPVAEF